ncbi:unnamed protein product [Lathyrus oleraceus]
MARSLPLVSIIFVFLLLLVATDMGPSIVAGAGTCPSPSTKFKGVCVSDFDCMITCQMEGLSEGKCQSLKCICAKPC